MAERDFWEYGNAVYPSQDIVARYLAPLARLFSPGRTVADLACGRGEFLRVLAGLGHKPVGVDTSEHSRQLCSSAGFPFYEMDIVNFLQADPVPYDALFSYGLLEHLLPADFGRLFAAMGKNCPKGTEVVFATHNPKSIQAHLFPLYMDLTHQRLYSEEVLTSAFKAHGFDVTKVAPLAQKENLVYTLVSRENLQELANLKPGLFNSLRVSLARLLFVGQAIERIKSVESTLQGMANLLNYPMDYFVFAVKK
jgi:cyclopropane fatty-acyl-phospholipid synthase-like methyltransferase